MSAARLALRSPTLRLATRRFQSTTTEKATEAAKDTAGKAQQGLSKVSSAAGPAIAGAARGVGNTLNRIGGPAGRLVGFVERSTPFVIYYSKVTLELGKLIFQGQKMSPPSIATFQSYYQSIFRSIQSRSIPSPQSLIQNVRNMGPAQLATAGVVAAEVLGFFTVGEMLGRFKVVGYHGETAHH